MNDETIIFAGNRKKPILVALGSAVFVCLIFFTGKGDTFSFLGIAFFGLGILVSLYSLIPGTIQLKVDRAGVEMKSLFKPLKISWMDVDEFYVGYIRSGFTRTKMISIRYSASYKRLRAGRKILKVATGMEGALPDHFNRSAEEICEILNSYKRKYIDSNDQQGEHYGKLD